MVNACILIKASPIKFEQVLIAVKQMKEVKKAYVTYGRFDIVSFIEARNNNDVAEVSARINGLEGVRSSETLVEA